MDINYDKYKMIFDYHTHTIFSHGNHGKGTIEENVQAAIKQGLEGIAITDHGPGHLGYGVYRKNFPVMRAEVDRLKAIYTNIDIYLGVEANIIRSDNYTDLKEEEFKYLDFVIAGYHYGIPHGSCVGNWLDAHHAVPEFYGKKLLIKNTDMTLKCLYENDIKILTHPGDKGRFDIKEISRACDETNTLMEISTWHDHLTVDEIKIAAKTGVKFVISSDAHTPDRVGSYKGGIKRALEAGLDIERIVNIREV